MKEIIFDLQFAEEEKVLNELDGAKLAGGLLRLVRDKENMRKVNVMLFGQLNIGYLFLDKKYLIEGGIENALKFHYTIQNVDSTFCSSAPNHKYAYELADEDGKGVVTEKKILGAVLSSMANMQMYTEDVKDKEIKNLREENQELAIRLLKTSGKTTMMMNCEIY